MIDDNVKVYPALKLSLPVGDGGKRCDDEEGAAHTGLVTRVHEAQGLDGLAQTHLIRQDAVVTENKCQFCDVEKNGTRIIAMAQDRLQL